MKILIPGREGSIIVPSCIRGFQALGHEVKYIELKNDRNTGLLKPIDPQDLLNEVISFGPDLIFDINGAGCDSDGIILSSYKILGIPVFVWFVDNPLLFLKNGDNRHLHLFNKLVFDRYLKDRMEGLGVSNVYHLPLGTDIEYFRPLNHDPGKYKADVSFAGELYADRCRLYRRMLHELWPDMPAVMNDVINYSVKLLVNGEKMLSNDVLHEALKQFGIKPEYPADDIEWILSIIIEYESGRDLRIHTLRSLIRYNVNIYGDNISQYLPAGSHTYPSVPYFEELPKVYNATSININISRTQLRSAVNQRVFDVPACKSFLLTDYSEEMEDYFNIGREVGCYRNRDELARLVRYYLDNPHIRTKIAEAGYERVVEEHNYTERMKRVIDIYNKLDGDDTTFVYEKDEAYESANVLLGQLYLRNGDKLQAKDYFRRGLNNCSVNYINNLNTVGVSLLMSREYEDSIPLFTEASNLDPGEPSFIANIGLAYENLGRYDDAEDYYRKAMGVKPDFSHAVSNLSRLTAKRTSHGINSVPRISLCMIVKNEEVDLPRCLDSVRGVVNETIIVDTGSTDRTMEIASKYGAKIIRFEWIDDFSAARNVSIRAATVDWILILDADEIIAKRDIECLLTLCKSTEYDAYGLQYRNYTNVSSGAVWVPNDNTYAEGNGISGWFPTRKVRLFRNDRKIRFTGAVHEVAEPSIRQNGLRIGEAHFPVHHYGELKKTINDKKRKYLEYGKKKIEAEPENPMAFYEYGVQCSEFGVYEEAVEAFKRVLELAPGFPSVESQLGMSLFNLAHYEECIIYLQKGIAREPDNPGLYNNFASVYLETGELDKAAELYNKAISIHPGYAAAYKNLGLTFLKSGMIDKAIESLRKSVSLNPAMEDVSRLINELEGKANKTAIRAEGVVRLSLCMIVRNEAERLQACLESVRGIVDEIIIVDTGSTDSTCEVAVKCGAKIFQHEWREDFSASRNISLQNASGDYILWLDADERISPESEQAMSELKRSLTIAGNNAFTFIIRNKREDNNDESFRRMRLFPNKHGIKFSRKVHEDVTDSLNSMGIRLCNTDIVVEHDGYLTEGKLQSKVKRNLQLLLAQDAESPSNMMTSFYIANSYYCLGRIDEAIEHMVKVTKCRKPSLVRSSWFPFAFVKLAQFYRESGRFEMALVVYDELLNLFPDFSVGHFFKGEFLYFQKKYELALNEFDRVNLDRPDIYEYPVPAGKMRYLINYYAGACLIETGKYDLASEYFVKAMADGSEEINLHLSLSRLFAIAGDIESCVGACNKVLKQLGIDKHRIIDSLEDIAGVYREIGSHLEGLSRHQESLEAYKAAVSVLQNRELSFNAVINSTL